MVSKSSEAYEFEVRFLGHNLEARTIRVMFYGINRTLFFLEDEELTGSWRGATPGDPIQARFTPAALSARGVLDQLLDISNAPRGAITRRGTDSQGPTIHFDGRGLIAD